MSKPRIKVIVGSTRPGRFGIQPATWIVDLAKHHPAATYELIDLAEVNLPFLDEAVPPSMASGDYANEHTRQWSAIVGQADGFIFVTPEYNHGIPAPLKNAIDFAAGEWHYKPVAFVSYGANSGGVRAVEQLRQVVGWLRMYDLHDEVAIKNYWTQLDELGNFHPSKEQTDDATRLLKNIAFWSERMAQARKKLEL